MIATVTDPVSWLVVLAVVVCTCATAIHDGITDRDMRTLRRRRTFMQGLAATVSRHRTPGEATDHPPGP